MLQSLVIQNLIVAAIVLTATVLLAIRASKYFRSSKGSQAGCGSGCGNCPSQQPVKADAPKLLQLGSPNRGS